MRLPETTKDKTLLVFTCQRFPTSTNFEVISPEPMQLPQPLLAEGNDYNVSRQVRVGEPPPPDRGQSDAGDGGEREALRRHGYLLRNQKRKRIEPPAEARASAAGFHDGVIRWTVRYAEALARQALNRAVHADPALALGVQVMNGQVVHPAVAGSLGIEYTPLRSLVHDPLGPG